MRHGPATAGDSLGPSLIERGLWILAVYLLFFGGYVTANRTIALESCRDLTTAMDRAIPFVPGAVYPLLLAYVVIPSPALLLASRRDLARAGLAFAALIAVSCALFFALPVAVPRPASVPDGLSGALVGRLWASDRPVCGFPSLHVSASLLAAVVGLRAHRRVGALLLLAWGATAAATLLVKQHGVVDVLGGTVLGSAVGAGAWRLLAGRGVAPKGETR